MVFETFQPVDIGGLEVRDSRAQVEASINGQRELVVPAVELREMDVDPVLRRHFSLLEGLDRVEGRTTEGLSARSLAGWIVKFEEGSEVSIEGAPRRALIFGVSLGVDFSYEDDGSVTAARKQIMAAGREVDATTLTVAATTRVMDGFTHASYWLDGEERFDPLDRAVNSVFGQGGVMEYSMSLTEVVQAQRVSAALLDISPGLDDFAVQLIDQAESRRGQ